MSIPLGKLMDEMTIKFSLSANEEMAALQRRGVPPVDALQITVCASISSAIATFRSLFFHYNLPFTDEHQDMLRAELERQFKLPITMTDVRTGKPVTFN